MSRYHSRISEVVGLHFVSIMYHIACICYFYTYILHLSSSAKHEYRGPQAHATPIVGGVNIEVEWHENEKVFVDITTNDQEARK